MEEIDGSRRTVTNGELESWSHHGARIIEFTVTPEEIAAALATKRGALYSRYGTAIHSLELDPSEAMKMVHEYHQRFGTIQRGPRNHEEGT